MKIASYFHRRLGGVLHDLTDPDIRESFPLHTAHEEVILSFPVYAQRIPIPLRAFFKQLSVKRLIINVTFGGFSYGNALYEAYKCVAPNVLVGYSITPVRHAYLSGDVRIDYERYEPLIDRFPTSSSGITPPYRFKNVFAHLFERTRTRINDRITIDRKTCIDCHRCQDACPMRAIDSDYTLTSDCLRCDLCVKICPVQAITTKKSLFLKLYLRKKPKRKTIIR
ncbi:MAG: 4Fe-4S binding protein [Acholeplasmataceae bacterium]